MERRSDHVVLTHDYRTIAVHRENFYALADRLDDRRSDEDGMQDSDAIHLDVVLEAVDLTTVSVAVNDGVQHPDLRDVSSDNCASEEDGAGASAEHGQTVLDPLTQRVDHSVLGEHEADRRRLPSRQNETVHRLQIFDRLHLGTRDVEPAHEVQMLPDVPLKREDAYTARHLYQPRSCSRVDRAAIS